MGDIPINSKGFFSVGLAMARAFSQANIGRRSDLVNLTNQSLRRRISDKAIDNPGHPDFFRLCQYYYETPFALVQVPDCLNVDGEFCSNLVQDYRKFRQLTGHNSQKTSSLWNHEYTKRPLYESPDILEIDFKHSLDIFRFVHSQKPIMHSTFEKNFWNEYIFRLKHEVAYRAIRFMGIDERIELHPDPRGFLNISLGLHNMFSLETARFNRPFQLFESFQKLISHPIYRYVKGLCLRTMGQDDFEPILDLICKKPDSINSLERFIIRYINMGDNSFSDFVRRSKPNVPYLEIPSINISNSALEAAVKTSPETFLGLKGLNISLNPIGDRGAASILSSLQEIEHLSMEGCGVSDEGFRHLLPRSSSILALNISSNGGITIRSLHLIENAGEFKKLEEINISNTGLEQIETLKYLSANPGRIFPSLKRIIVQNSTEIISFLQSHLGDVEIVSNQDYLKSSEESPFHSKSKLSLCTT